MRKQVGVKLAFRPPSALSDRLSSGFVLANHIFINVDKILREKETLPFYPPVDLYLISEKSIWKNQVRRTGFLLPVQPAKINFKICSKFVKFDFYNLIFQKSCTDQQVTQEILSLPCEEEEFGTVKAELSGGRGEW